MSHPLRFGHSYGTEMLRNKVRLKRERVTDLGLGEAGRREMPGLGIADENAFPLKATRIS